MDDGTESERRYVGVGVGAIVRRGDELLLIRRRHVHGDGTWSTPGGHVEFGETLEQCAIRETLEETGVTVSAATFAGVTNDVMPTDGKHYVTVWMACEHLDGEPRVNDAHELDEVGWFALDDLPTPRFIPLENLLAGRAHGATPLAPTP